MAVCPSPSGSPFHNSDLWSKGGGDKLSPRIFFLPPQPPFLFLATLTAPAVSVPPPTTSWKEVRGGHFRCQGAEGLCWLRSANRKAALFPPLFPLGPWPSTPWSWLIAGLWCLRSSGCRVLALKGPCGEQEVSRSSQVCMWVWGGEGIGEVGLGSQPSLQEAGSSGGWEKSSLTRTQGPHCLLSWPRGALHKETASSL